MATVLSAALLFFGSDGPNVIEKLLQANRPLFAQVLAHPERYRVQILYTQVNRDRANQLSFEHVHYRLSRREYFYPASLVKLPVAALALEKLSDLAIPGLDRSARMETEAAGPCQKSTTRDPSSETGFPSAGHYVRRMLLLSDNEAYNRLYELLGQREIHRRLAALGYSEARIVDRFDPFCDATANRSTNPVVFYGADGSVLYREPPKVNPKELPHPLGAVRVGLGYVGYGGRRIRRPKDFTRSNFLPLEDAHSMLRSIVFPDSVPDGKGFRIGSDDRQFLLRYLSRYPREADYPLSSGKPLPDSFKKYFIYGASVERIANDRLRVFNVVGKSYGFLSETAFIVDFEKKVEFFLSAVIYVNRDGILNDGKYEYESVGLPFLKNLGRVVYDYEVARKKEFVPDLTPFDLR